MIINDDFPKSILLFGCGNMAGAMLRGWIKAGVSADRFTVVDPVAINLPEGVTVHRDGAKVDAQFNHLLLGIKPQMLGDLAGDIDRLLSEHANIVSILAGTRCETLQKYFPDACVIRLMPNLAASIGKSPLGLWSHGIDDDKKSGIEAWFGPLGSPVWLANEGQMDAVTALAGSGPAFVYRFIDALAKAGAELGLAPAQSAELALSMVEGAALLAAQASENPTELATRVTSPGGTTAAGLAILDEGQAMEKLILATLSAASDRGAELAQDAVEKVE